MSTTTPVTIAIQKDQLQELILSLDEAIKPRVPFIEDIDAMRKEASEVRLALITTVRDRLKDHCGTFHKY